MSDVTRVSVSCQCLVRLGVRINEDLVKYKYIISLKEAKMVLVERLNPR